MEKILTIIMVARNHLEQTQAALQSLHKHTDPRTYQLYFMDNGSDHETADWVLTYCRSVGITCKYTYNDNVGWIESINKAYKIVDTEFSLTCHNDVIFCKHWFDNMLRKFEDPKVAAVGPVVTFALGPQALSYAYANMGCDVKYLLGLFFMCRDSVLEEIVNEDGTYLDTCYGMGDKEEFELCYRIRKAGYKLAIAYDVVIEHEGEKSFIDYFGSQRAFHEYQEKQSKMLVRRLGQEVVNDIFTIHIPRPVKLLIGIMTRTNYIHTRFMFSLMDIWGRTLVQKEVFHIPRAMVAESRNKMIKKALDENFTHILFIDDDMIFDGTAATKLLSHQLPIVSGVAFQRAKPYMICQFMADEERKILQPFEAINVGLHYMDAVGGFFMLVETDVLKKIPSPWFKYGDNSLGYGDGETGIGEDVYFGLKAKKYGIRTVIDTDLIIKHIGYEEEVDETHYLKFKQDVADGKASYS